MPKKTLCKIVNKQHDFVVQVKNNQKELFKWLSFNATVSEPIDYTRTHDHNEHGRHEERTIRVYDDLYQIGCEWNFVKRFVCIDSNVRTSKGVTQETRYYMTSLEADANSLGTIIRQHWRIENALHYVKDIAFKEDFSRMRTHQIPKIASLIRSLAINVMNINKFKNITQTRKQLAWNSMKLFSLNGI